MPSSTLVVPLTDVLVAKPATENFKPSLLPSLVILKLLPFEIMASSADDQLPFTLNQVSMVKSSVKSNGDSSVIST